MRTLIFALGLFFSLSLHATETLLTVRVKARDAKFIGSSIGGAMVVVKDALTGEVLDRGKTRGSTGNTNLIMNVPYKRGSRISDDSAASFEALINIDEPTFITVEVHAPYNRKQARVMSSTQLWMIPGKDITGEGLIIEVPGFVVDVVGPRTHQSISLKSLDKGELKIEAHIVMMCGCPIESDGLWDANDMEVVAMIARNGEGFGNLSMNSVATNTFEGRLKLEQPGLYEVVVYAINPLIANTGVDRVSFIVSE